MQKKIVGTCLFFLLYFMIIGYYASVGGATRHTVIVRVLEACKQQNHGSMQAAELWKHACKQQN